MRPERIEAEEQEKQAFIAALWDAMGNASAACRITGINYMRQWRWQRDDDRFRDEMTVIREKNLDILEQKHALMTENEDPAVALKALQFELSKKGRHRGYGDKVEVSNTGAPAVMFVAPHQLDPEQWAKERQSAANRAEDGQ